MFKRKRKGFTLMEIVLVMVLIAILATGVAIGFTTYINKGHETGITTDYNSTFKNPIRMNAIEKGKLPNLASLKETVIADGFIANTGAGWQTNVTDSADLTATTDGITFGVEKGNKRYQITYEVAFDLDGSGAGTDTADAIVVRADHSDKETTVVYALNEAKNDVVTILGTGGASAFVPDSE